MSAESDEKYPAGDKYSKRRLIFVPSKWNKSMDQCGFTGMKQSLFFALAIIVFISACNTEKKQQQSRLSPQAYVEQAHFTDLHDDSVHIADYKGKVVLIDFWETWCKPCIASFPGLDSLKKEYPNSFEVLAVTPGFSDTKEHAREFANNHNYDFTYLMDTDGLHQKLNVFGIPYKVYVGADGKFIKTTMGSSGPEGDFQKIKHIIEEHKSSVGSGQEAVNSRQ